METNLAIKLPTAEEVIKEFQAAHNSLDLLRVFLITGTADINRSYEFVRRIMDKALEADKAKFKNALKILENIELKRIALTASVYNVNDVQLPNMSVETTSENEANVETTPEEGTAPTIMMLPALNDILERAKTIFRVARARNDSKEITFAGEQVLELLKTTVGQNKVLNAEGKPELWDNERINEFIKTENPTVTDESTQQEPVKIGFETIHTFMNDQIIANKKEPEIKDALKNILLGKIFTSKESDYLIKDEAVFEDFYTRMLGNIVQVAIAAIEKKNAETVQIESKEELANIKIEAEVKPFLVELDKDATQVTLTPVTRKIRNVYEELGIKKSLKDSWLIARKLATILAPNLIKRIADANVADKPIEPEQMSGTSAPLTEPEAAPVEIYDESHNIQESNKELWAEVEKFEYLNELFTKAQELYALGKWKDALSMSIILISSGKIKETATSKEVIKWDVDQIKSWYTTVVEPSIVPFDDKVKENETETTGTDIQEKVEDSTETAEPHAESVEKTETTKQGPVPQTGTIDSKEAVSKLLKDSSLWKDTYKFKSFQLKTDHYLGGAMSLEIVDATDNQEKDLLITETNMTKFFDTQKDRLIKSRNDEKDVRNIVKEKLSEYYDVNGSEIKRIVGGLLKEADIIRKKAKENREAAKTVVPNTYGDAITEKVMDEPAIDNKEDVTVPPTTPVAEEKSVELAPSQENLSTAISDVPATKEAIETTTGEDTANSNDDPKSYPGFESITDAKKKWEFDKAVYAKIMEYPKSEDGIKAVFDAIDNARKNHNFRRSFLRNYKVALPVDLLATVNNIFTQGTALAKKQ